VPELNQYAEDEAAIQDEDETGARGARASRRSRALDEKQPLR